MTTRPAHVGALLLLAACTSADDVRPSDGGAPDPEGPPRVEHIDVGSKSACALISNGAVYCWGQNSYGELGVPGFREAPALVEGLPGRATRILAASDFTCVVLESEELWCFGDAFGDKFDGALGGWVPVEVPSGKGADDIAAGYLNICKRDGSSIWCWGYPYGAGAAVDADVPVRALTSGYPRCFLTDEQTAHCWGDNSAGELGNGTTTPSQSPGPTLPVPEPIAQLKTAPQTTFAITESGGLYGWGLNGYNYVLGLGPGDTEDRTSPTLIPGIPPVDAVDGSFGHACAVDRAGVAYCWGRGLDGELGNGRTGTAGNSEVPTPVTLGAAVLEVAVGEDRTCLLDEAHEVYCFGRAPLGDGTYQSSALPVRVKFPWETGEASDAGD